MGPHCLTFTGWNLESRKKLVPVGIMNSASTNCMNFVTTGGNFHDSVLMSIMNGVRSVTPPKISSVNLNV